MRDLDGALLGHAAREQALLQGQGQVVLTGVPAGVVDAEGGAGREFPGQPAVVVPEGCRVLRAVEAGDAQQDAAGEEGDADEGVHLVGEDPPGVLGLLVDPTDGFLEVGFQHGPPTVQAPHVGGAGPQPDPAAGGVEGAVVADAVEHRPVQLAPGVGGLLAAQHRLRDVDGDVVGQPRNRHLR